MPVELEHEGKRTTFLKVGELAKVLGRSADTVRRWEKDGVIPKATFVMRQDANTVVRLYSVQQAFGLKKLVREFKVVRGTIIPDEFKRRAKTYFQ